MTVSLTLLRWVRLYPSISARLKELVSDRVHMVRTVPSSVAAVPVGVGPSYARWHAGIASTATSTTTHRHPALRAPMDPPTAPERMLAITSMLSTPPSGR